MTPSKLPADEAKLKTLTFPAQVAHRKIRDDRTPRAQDKHAPPPFLRVRFVGVRVAGDKLVGEAVLVNPRPETVELRVWPFGGAFPYGGTCPLTLGFARSADEVVRYAGERHPPEPPPPMVITVPGRSRLRFFAEIALGNYSYRGSPEVALDWGFHFYEGTDPSGTVKIRLPNR